MKTCHTCRKQIYDEPFRWHGGLEIFCSEDCLPEGVLDEPYAMEYTDLLAAYNECVEAADDIENWGQRDELLGEIDYCEKQCAEYVFGDTEGFYYKERLRELHQWFVELYEKTANCLLNWDHYLFDTGLGIYWEGIIYETSKEVGIGLQKTLEGFMKENEMQPMHLYDHPFDAFSKAESILVFPQKEHYQNAYGQIMLKELYDICVEFLEQAPVKPGFEMDHHISFIKLFTCPICGRPEPIEDSNVNESFQVYACSYCYDKRKEEFI